MADDLMNIRIKEAEAVAELQENKLKLMELETQVCICTDRGTCTGRGMCTGTGTGTGTCTGTSTGRVEVYRWRLKLTQD